MSTFHPTTLACACGQRFEADVADSLHVSTRADLRDAILRGVFHRFACPACGSAILVEKLFAYTDFDRWHWFTVFPDDHVARAGECVRFAEDSFHGTVEVNAPPLVKSWAPALRRRQRVIFGVLALREKLLVLDAELDDRTLEAVKIEWAPIVGAPLDGPARLLFERIDGDDLLFAWAERIAAGAPPARALRVPLEAYQRLALDTERARALAPAVFSTTAVDYRLALMPSDLPGLGAEC